LIRAGTGAGRLESALFMIEEQKTSNDKDKSNDLAPDNFSLNKKRPEIASNTGPV